MGTPKKERQTCGLSSSSSWNLDAQEGLQNRLTFVLSQNRIRLRALVCFP